MSSPCALREPSTHLEGAGARRAGLPSGTERGVGAPKLIYPATRLDLSGKTGLRPRGMKSTCWSTLRAVPDVLRGG